MLWIRTMNKGEFDQHRVVVLIESNHSDEFNRTDKYTNYPIIRDECECLTNHGFKINIWHIYLKHFIIIFLKIQMFFFCSSVLLY